MTCGFTFLLKILWPESLARPDLKNKAIPNYVDIRVFIEQITRAVSGRIFWNCAL
jgi:hypothetical protein